MKTKINAYFRALIGTTLVIVLIAFGSNLLSFQPFSFLWFNGAIIIFFLFLMMLYINYKFIIYT